MQVVFYVIFETYVVKHFFKLCMNREVFEQGWSFMNISSWIL